MMTHTTRQRRTALALILALTLAACANPGARPESSTSARSDSAQPLQRSKSITVGVTSTVGSIGILGDTTTVGGWIGAGEVHSAGLVTSGFDNRQPIGRLAERVPTIENGDMALLPDGRMRVVYPLRKGVTWQDGTPFTARDLTFSFRVNSDPGLPNPSRDAINQMQSVEAPDDYTFIVNFKGPYYLGGSLGLRLWWSHPQHLLGEPYEQFVASKNTDAFANLPYWTSEYVNLGPFRLTSFDPAEGLVFQAYEGYFLGRPRVDTIRVRLFGDPNALFANLLSGTVDLLLESTLYAELGIQLKDTWDKNGQGTVYIIQISHRLLAPQWRPSVQAEPANLEIPVRAALYRALDREAITEALQANRDLAAWELLPPNDPVYPATKDAFRHFAYDPDRAKAELVAAGWNQGVDGVLRNNSDARRFHTALWADPRVAPEIPAIADFWRRVGLDVDEFPIPAAQVRVSEYRASYPGWEATANAGGDGILGKLDGPAASAQTRWVGNRGGYEDPRAQRLVDAYRSSLSDRDRLQTMKAVSDFVTAELPFLVLYGTADQVAVRAGISALDDYKGGDSGGRPYGTYSRNAHQWDVK